MPCNGFGFRRSLRIWEHGICKDRVRSVPLEVISRAPSGSPAVGLSKIHSLEQLEIISRVFKPCTCELKNKYCGLQCEEGSKRFNRRNQYEYLEDK